MKKFFLAADVKDSKEWVAQIESDLNYQPGINNDELIELIRGPKGEHIYHNNQIKALAIKPLEIREECQEACYQAFIAQKGRPFPDWNTTFYIDDSAVIVINKDDSAYVHTKEDYDKGDFSNPLDHISVDYFLEKRCLHPNESPAHSF